jgi:hypothetical protein
MDSITISNIISNKKSVSTADLSELKILADKYPFAQLFSILYLKSLSKTNTFSFDEELNQYAYKITDRVKLYEIIKSDDEKVQFEVSDSTPSLEVEQQETKQEHIDNTLLDVQASNNKPETVSETIESDTEKEVVIDETSPTEEEAIDTSLELVDNTELPSETLEEEEEEEILNDDLIQTNELKEESIPEPIAADETLTQTEDEVLEASILTNAVEQIYPFTLASEKKAPEQDVVSDDSLEDDEVLEKTNVETPKFNSFSGWLSQGIKQNQTTISAEKPSENVLDNKKEELIDKFIEKNPSISRPKKEFFSAPKKAQESVVEDNLLYSETLANIFVLQGNLPLAIKAYEQLCLTIPEKKLIFAKKIEELKNRINNLK